MEGLGIDLLGLTEMRWPKIGDFWSGKYCIIHSMTVENRPSYEGVGIILYKRLGNKLKSMHNIMNEYF